MIVRSRLPIRTPVKRLVLEVLIISLSFPSYKSIDQNKPLNIWHWHFEKTSRKNCASPSDKIQYWEFSSKIVSLYAKHEILKTTAHNLTPKMGNFSSKTNWHKKNFASVEIFLGSASKALCLKNDKKLQKKNNSPQNKRSSLRKQFLEDQRKNLA